jgi:hypothetical protein
VRLFFQSLHDTGKPLVSRPEITEPPALRLPAISLDCGLKASSSGHLALTLFHHPYGWKVARVFSRLETRVLPTGRLAVPYTPRWIAWTRNSMN